MPDSLNNYSGINYNADGCVMYCSLANKQT